MSEVEKLVNLQFLKKQENFAKHKNNQTKILSVRIFPILFDELTEYAKENNLNKNVLISGLLSDFLIRNKIKSKD